MQQLIERHTSTTRPKILCECSLVPKRHCGELALVRGSEELLPQGWTVPRRHALTRDSIRLGSDPHHGDQFGKRARPQIARKMHAI